MTHTPTVAVDFDGVIHRYSRGYGDGSIYDLPVPGALAGLSALTRSYCVFVHTTRAPGAVARWINDEATRAQIDVVARISARKLEVWNVQGPILVTDRKLPAIAYLDDRAVRFTCWDDVPYQVAELRIPPHVLDCEHDPTTPGPFHKRPTAAQMTLDTLARTLLGGALEYCRNKPVPGRLWLPAGFEGCPLGMQDDVLERCAEITDFRYEGAA